MQSEGVTEKELVEAWIDIIAKCIEDAHRKGVLDKVIRSKGYEGALDWIGHRVMFAKNRHRVGLVIQDIAHGLSLQAPMLPLESLRLLEEHEKEALRVLRENYLSVVLYASEKAGFLKTKKKGGG